MSVISLDSVPALIQRERAGLAEISSPAAAADAEKRAAAIAELTKRAGLAVPIQNEATFLRAECLERLAVLVDEEEKPKGGRGKTSPKSGGLSSQRIAEGRSLARTGAVQEAKEEAEKRPDIPVSMDSILKRAKRRDREQALGGRREKKEAEARKKIKDLESPYELIVSDITDWRPKDVAAVITDPPYIGDSIPLYEKLRDFAVDVLPEGAPLVVMTWQAILPSVMDALRHEELAYRWVICWRYASTENTVDYARRVFDCWKPVLIYHKGSVPKGARMFRDEIAGGEMASVIDNAEPDKGSHEWGQAIDGFERLVTSFSEAGDIICDPFLGGGTTAVAALAAARRFVGCDINAEAIRITEERLNDA